MRLCSSTVRCNLSDSPYHGPHQANGLAFSVAEGVQVPPSLRNIFKEAQTDVGVPKPRNGCLEPWARQGNVFRGSCALYESCFWNLSPTLYALGVLLLNTVLTVTARQANSHKKQGWEQFTDSVIAKLNKEKSNLVFLLYVCEQFFLLKLRQFFKRGDKSYKGGVDLRNKRRGKTFEGLSVCLHNCLTTRTVL